jgi:hypothetical protein
MRAGPRWRVALEAWAVVVVAAALWQIIGKLHLYQWDVIVYWWGGRAFAHGQSPYGAIPGQPEYLHFVYPPIVAALFAPLSILKPGVAKLLWITLKALAFWLCVRLWRRTLDVEQHVVPSVFFFTFAFGSAALVDFTAGNIAVFEQLVLWIAFVALLARRRWTFAVLVVLAALCKLTPVFFLGLLLVIDERPHWRPFLGGSALMAAFAGANVLLFPSQVREFRTSVSALGERGWGDPSTLGVMQDLVDQLRGLRLPLPEVTAYALYLSAAVTILALTVRWWRAQRVARTARPVEIILVALVTYALVMPRMKDYSYVALLPVAWYALAGRQAVTASLAVLAVLVPRPLPQLKLWLPLVPQPYVYAPLLAALVLWTMLTSADRDAGAVRRTPADDSDEMSEEPVAISAA